MVSRLFVMKVVSFCNGPENVPENVLKCTVDDRALV